MTIEKRRIVEKPVVNRGLHIDESKSPGVRKFNKIHNIYIAYEIYEINARTHLHNITYIPELFFAASRLNDSYCIYLRASRAHTRLINASGQQMHDRFGSELPYRRFCYIYIYIYVCVCVCVCNAA